MGCWPLGLLLIFLLGLPGCATNPVTGKSSFNMLSEAEENRQGEEAYRQILGKERPTTNRALDQQIREIGQNIARVSGRPDFNWEFTTLESETPNAFCLPGGKVAVYTGILPFAQTEAGLATVMGHEIGHALARHGGQRVSQQLGTNLAILAVGTTALSQNKNRDMILAAMGVGATLGVILPYSRSHEEEADEIGIILMARAGYDPREAVRFWQRFGKAGGKSPPEFLSTHPRSANRAKNLEALLPLALAEYEKAPVKRGLGRLLKTNSR